MRSALLFLLALGVFLAGYFALAWLMPDPQAPPRRQAQVVPPVLRDSDRVIGDIDGVTLRSHDPKTGAPIAEVTIGEYRRVNDQEVLLRDIQATILLDAGVVKITAPTGTVNLESELEQEQGITEQALGRADLARLQDVTIRWFESAAASAAGPSAALLTLRVDNLVYDNNRYSLFTADAVIAGATVLADDVPVEVRGRDYDFDGRGLLVRWDAQTRRPTLLRIAHGHRLTIKTERGFMPTRIVGTEQEGLRPLMLASLEQDAAADVLSARTAPTHVYRATMTQNLRAEQAMLTKLEADAATVLFALDAIGDTSDAAPAQPATTRAQAAPQTRPAAEPFDAITLFWEGPLVIEAVEEGQQSLESRQDMRLALVGSPLVLSDEGVEARGLRLDYAKAADRLVLSGDDNTPVTLIEAEGSTLVTNQIVANPNAGRARAGSAGYAEVVSGESEPLQLRWERECDFSFAEGEDGNKQLRSVAARGSVTVRHPQVSLDSDALDVLLDPPQDAAGDPELKSVFADGSVRCTILEEGEDPTGFTSQRLTLTLPQGLDGPLVALAEGNVRTEQRGQRLSTDRMEAKLQPDADEKLQLTELIATGNVQGADDHDRRYRASVLRATPIPSRAAEVQTGAEQEVHVRLEGEKDLPAVVEIGTDRLAGPVLEFDSGDQAVHVPGSGEMHTMQKGPSGRALPLAVTWAGSMHGNRAEVQIQDDVKLKGTEGPGEGNPLVTSIDIEARSATLRLTQDAPEKLAGDNAEAGDATTRPADLAGSVEQVTLRGGLRATVEERHDEALLRSFDLRSESLDAWPGQRTARVVIDTPGRVLVRDLRPVVEADAGGATTRPMSSGFRGNAAVQWNQRLSFEPESGELVLAGGVSLAVEPLKPDSAGDGQAGRAFRLESAEARVQTRTGADGRLEMRSASATGQARFSTEGMSFEGAQIKYDPLSQRITASGAAGSPVVVFDGDGVPTGRFSQLVYNLETGQIESLRDVATGG
jgi:lipopolysaccharide export system protein LptA